MRYYGLKTNKQGGQLDKYIHENYIREPFNDGSFLEMGAVDGIRLTNTKFFEDNMGFNQGVLIEADPEPFKSLQANRPNCECFNYVVHSKNKEVEFLTHTNAVLGCVNHEESKRHREIFHEHERGKGKSFKKILPAERLDVILSKTKLKYIDFWSLDVEGSELQCLNSMDWSIPVGLVCIENQENQKEIHTIMTDKGFTLIHQNIMDGFYFNFKYFRKEMFSIEKR
jgi:FkbM family methyltransferase